MNRLKLFIVPLLLTKGEVQASQHRFSDLVTRRLGLDAISIGQDSYRIFRKSARLKGIPSLMPQDEFEHLYRIEKMFKASDIIAQHTGFTRSNASAVMVSHRLACAMLNSPTVAHATDEWRKIEAQTNADSSWKKFADISDITTPEIQGIYASTQSYASVADEVIVPDLLKRAYGSHALSHKSCDERQVAQVPHSMRTLSKFNKSGLAVTVSPDGMQLLRATGDSSVPLLEATKNQRILSVSGLGNSKVALLVHDLFDHYYTFKLLEREGILGKYSEFMRQVGSPQNCDILSRESELIASIAYDYRYTSFPMFRQPSLLTSDDLAASLSSGHSMSLNQAQALKLFRKRMASGEFGEQAARIMSGVSLELLQQRMKNGTIKILDHDKHPVDILRPLDPEYVALAVDVVHALDHSKQKTHRNLRNTQVCVEDLLQRAKSGAIIKDELITSEKIDSFDSRSGTVPLHHVQWIERNLGAISDRNPIS